MKSTDQAGGARALRARVQAFVRRFGLLRSAETPCGKPLQPSHAHALVVLAERAETHRATLQRDLAEALGLDKSSVTRLCQRMEQEGHLRLAVSGDDGRARLLTLTAKGARLAREVEASSTAKFERVVAGIPDADRARILDALDRLNAAIDDAAAKEAP